MVEPVFHATTILAVRNKKGVAIGGDGQVTLGQTVVKQNAKKVRKLYHDKVLAGFAGSTADAFTLFEKFEAELEKAAGNLTRAAVELGKLWRSDKFLRRLEALLIVANRDQLYLLSGAGDVIEPEDGLAAIGSGGMYALAAAKGILRYADQSPEVVVRAALEIASSICIFTNQQIETLTLS